MAWLCTSTGIDVVLVVHRAAGRTSVLSIPRDLLVSPVAGKIERLTLTLQDGPQSLVDGLCNSLGIAGDHHHLDAELV